MAVWTIFSPTKSELIFNLSNPFPESEESHGKRGRVSGGGEGEDVAVQGGRVRDDGGEGEATAQCR